MDFKRKIVSIAFLIFAVLVSAQETPEIANYKITPATIYGQGKVEVDGNEELMDLWMDVYEPINVTKKELPAVILTHGGSFHRGNPRETYLEAGAQTTSMSNYAKRLASEGFVCFTIRYRMAGDNPIPSYEGYTNEDLDPISWTNPAGLHQVNTIRKRMNLSALTQDSAEVLKNAILAASEDLRMAIKYIKKNQKLYNIDKNKIAIGGFSAGAVTSISVSFGLQEEVAAVFTNSGFPSGFDIYKMRNNESLKPSILLFMGQNDIPAVTEALPKFLEYLKTSNVDYEFCWVPGFGHFYPGGAISLSNDGLKESVEERILKFLTSQLKN